MAKSYTIQFGSGNPTGFSGLSPTMLIFFNLATSATVAPPSISETPVGWGIYSFTYGTTQPIWFLADAATTSPGTAGRYVVGVIDPNDRADEYGNTLVAIGNTLTFNCPAGMGSTLQALGNTAVAIETNQGVTLVAIGNTAIAYGGTILQDVIQLGSTLVGIGNTAVALGNTAVALGAIGSSLAAIIGTTASPLGDNSTMPGDLFGYLKRTDAFLEGQQQFIKSSGLLTMFDKTGATTLSTRTITNNVSLVTKT